MRQCALADAGEAEAVRFALPHLVLLVRGRGRARRRPQHARHVAGGVSVRGGRATVASAVARCTSTTTRSPRASARPPLS
jgi:hypothetical protein